MANINSAGLDYDVQHAGTWGNVAVATAKIDVSAANIADVFQFLRLPAYVDLLDAILIVSNAGDALSTLTLGYVNTDGTAGGSTSHFLGATAISATGLTRADGATGIVTPAKDITIVGTLAGANLTQQTIVEAIVFYRYTGK